MPVGCLYDLLSKSHVCRKACYLFGLQFKSWAILTFISRLNIPMPSYSVLIVNHIRTERLCGTNSGIL